MAKIWIQLTHIGGCSSIHRDWYTHQIRSFHIKPMAMGWFPKLAVSGCFSAVSLDLGPPLTTGFLPNMSVSFCFGVGGPNPKKPSLTHWMWLQSFFRPARIPSSCYVAMVGGKCEVWPIKHRGNFQGCFCSKISNNDDNHQVLRRGYAKECGSPG